MLWGHLLARLHIFPCPLSSFLLSFISVGAQQQPVVFRSGVALYACVSASVCAWESEWECVGELVAAVSRNSLRRRYFFLPHTNMHKRTHTHTHLTPLQTDLQTLFLSSAKLLISTSVAFNSLLPHVFLNLQQALCVCVFFQRWGGGSALSLAALNIGAGLVPVTISDREREWERRRVAAPIKDWKRQFAERQRQKRREEVGVG